MKKRMTELAAVSAVAALGAAGALAAPPLVSNITMTQPQGTRKAVVTYETDEPGIATFLFKTGGVAVCHSEIVRTVTGDISRYLDAGEHSFAWDAGRDYPEHHLTNLSVVITLWATNNPPTYCAVSLVDTATARFYGSEDEVPFGVTDSRWKKDWLLLRKIPSIQGESVTLGSTDGEWNHQADETPRSVSITRPFYMGVFEVTQRQWELVGTRSKPSYWNNTTDWEERPVEQVSHYDIRSSASGNAAVAGTDWPNDGHAVGTGSFMKKLRAKTGEILTFDLPTEAQWEYACRAGTTGPWNNGIGASGSETDANLALLGRYQSNGGMNGNNAWPKNCFASNATAKAGTYLPNAWGLYDMHGNVWEWCLNYYITDDATLSGDDPAGPSLAVGSARVHRGGSGSGGASNCRSARRYGNSPSYRYSSVGFRVAAVAEVWITQ